MKRAKRNKKTEPELVGVCLFTVVTALPDVSLHLVVAVLGAEVHTGSKQHLRIALFHGDELSQVVGGVQGRSCLLRSLRRLEMQLRKRESQLTCSTYHSKP